jgi:hypothetical protein
MIEGLTGREYIRKRVKVPTKTCAAFLCDNRGDFYRTAEDRFILLSRQLGDVLNFTDRWGFSFN